MTILARQRPLPVVALVAFAAIALALVVASSSPLYLAGGSDAIVEIGTPALATKVFALALAVGGFGWALLGRRGGSPVRAALFLFGVLVVGVSTRAIMLNSKVGCVQEHLGFVVFDRACFDVAEGPSHDWRFHETWFGADLSSRRDFRTVPVLAGIWPWRIDLGYLATAIRR